MLTRDPEPHVDRVEPTARPPRDLVGRDRLLDVVRALAIGRVVLWHTWSSWWLSWFPAMPAMFFTTGALLEDSLDRRGWWATVRQRAHRLLLPYWVYGAVCWVIMLASGWRPHPGDVVGWIVPVVDPVGSPDLAGLWIPLWYVRAYVLFVLASGVLRWLLRQFGLPVIGLAVVATFSLWWAERVGVVVGVPLALGDGVAYSVFVLAGMRYRTHGAPSRRSTVVAGAALAALAVLWVLGFGPSDGVVNRSYPLTVLVGAAGVGLLLAFRDQVLTLGDRASRLVDLVGRRTLSIYLWHGLGLVVAQRLVQQRLGPGVLSGLAALVVVVAVTAGAVVVVGPLEDRTAGRSRRTGTSPRARRARRGGAVLVSIALVAAAVVSVDGSKDDVDATPAPLSGRAVVARAGLVEDALERAQSTKERDGVSGTVTTPAEVIDAWLTRNAGLQEQIGFRELTGAFVSASGATHRFEWRADRGDVVVTSVARRESSAATPPTRGDLPVAWWSMTKSATAVWLMRAVDAGTVRLDQTIDTWTPELPHASEITLEQLARHQSGIPSDLDSPLFESHPAADVQRFVDHPELRFAPGTGFDYSRIGYFVLALALERATGVTWRAAMEAMAAEAGVTLGFDEDLDPQPEVTDPDGHGYRGSLWSSGGIVSDALSQARFERWAFTDGLSTASAAAMSDFAADPDQWFYGIGLMPLCPCEQVGDRLRSPLAGLDSPTGSFAVDTATGASVALRPNAWFDADSPRVEFYELESQLLDSLRAS